MILSSDIPHGSNSLNLRIYNPLCLVFDTFLPFVNEHWDQIQNNVLVDLLDQCMIKVLGTLKSRLEAVDSQVLLMHDFELSPARRPKVLVQTAGHVSG